MTDKNLCMSHYLAFRFIEDEQCNFFDGLGHKVWKSGDAARLHMVETADDIDEAMREEIRGGFVPGKTAVFLSGGIDSAIVASYLPPGTKAYTFRCVAEGGGVVDEVPRAAAYAKAYGLDHETVDMTWADFERLTPQLLRHDGTPFHSIEVQLAKAAIVAKEAGHEVLMLGDGADILFGGLDKLLSADLAPEDFYRRFAYVRPETALAEPVDVTGVYRRFLKADGTVDGERYVREFFMLESSSSYMHAFEFAGIKTCAPYCAMRLARPLDVARVRNGEPKYLLRELFARRYPGLEIPRKIPLPRATDQWFADWNGPKRGEFLPGCHKGRTGDQKWLLWCLERFLDAHDEGGLP